MRTDFPVDFVFGTSTASYQIEGAAFEDGRGPSIWDTFSRTPGKVAGAHTGDVACDHYHRYTEDVALMADLGVAAYRFSISWPRLFPDGRGKANSRGRDFYDRLIDRLLGHGIDPWICLFHWDLPQALQDKGGWTNREITDWFGDYAAFVANSYGDRVRHFLMLNEPNVFALFGHLLGVHAPGLTNLAAYQAAVHHQNLAQGDALARLRSLNDDWQLGTALNLQPVHGATDSEEDVHAAELFDALWNRTVLDPLIRGGYPPLSEAMFAPVTREGDLERINQPVDLLGVNLYTRVRVRADPDSLVGIAHVPPPEGAEVTRMNWEVHPQALYDQLIELKDGYGNPYVFLTEIGAAFDDRPRGGVVDDQERIHFLRRYLGAAHRAMQEGSRLKGCFVWTLLDNFEWAEGYRRRFGLVHVDFATQQRTPKASFHWYRDLIRERSLDLPVYE